MKSKTAINQQKLPKTFKELSELHMLRPISAKVDLGELDNKKLVGRCRCVTAEGLRCVLDGLSNPYEPLRRIGRV